MVNTISDNSNLSLSFSTRLLAFFRNHALLLILMLALILVRNGMVIFDLWSVHDGGDLPESLISGNFAFDILDGTWRGWPAYLYRTEGHLGNELLASLIAIPLYLLFGNSLLVLSQVPILYSIGILILIYAISRRWLDKHVAGIAALIFVCSPMTVQSWAIYPYCIHLESAFFSLLAFYLFFRLLESDVLKKRLLFSAALGIISGVGVFQSEIYLLTLGVIFLFWFLNDKRFFLKSEFLAFFVCLLVGLAPYFYFCADTLPSFIKTLFEGGFSGAYIAQSEPRSYVTTLALMSVLFWPIDNLLLSLLSGLPVTLVALGALGLVVVLKDPLWKGHPLFSILALYCILYVFIALLTRVVLQYYFFSILPHMSIIFAACLSKLEKKYLRKNRFFDLLFYFSLIACCTINVYEIVRHFDLTMLRPQLKKQLAANGCCFYWPGAYFPPAGLKTEITREVERIATKTFFEEFTLRPGIPKKAIFKSKTSEGVFPLTSPQSYFVYGKDVSYVGLSRLADEIESRVSQNDKECAYKGLAVYYVNDNWLDDLLADFKAGIVEENIPPPYQCYFYRELTRKLFNRYRDNPNKLKEIISCFSTSKRYCMLKTEFIFDQKKK